MDFFIQFKDYKKNIESNINFELLNIFLNEQLVGIYHGSECKRIIIKFLNNPPSSKKVKKKIIYKNIAEIEMASNFENSQGLNIELFKNAYSLVREAILLAKDLFPATSEHFDKLVNDFESTQIHLPNTREDLVEYSQKAKEVKFFNNVKLTDTLVHSYYIKPRKLNKKIVGVRVFSSFDSKILKPYDFIYSEIFSTLLKNEGLKLPGYDEIYFNIGEKLDSAKQTISTDDWYKYTYSKLDLSKYLIADFKTKSKMIFESICEGLRLITAFDHLDKEIVERVINRISDEGIEMELTKLSKMTAKYHVEIIYTVPKNSQINADFFLKITVIKTNQIRKIKLESLNCNYADYSFNKILINNNSIVIKGKESERANISRNINGLPDRYEFDIQTLLV